MSRLTDFIERLYTGTATWQDLIQAKRWTLVREDPTCKCGHRAWNHGVDGNGVPSDCHKYGCNCSSFERAGL